MIRIRPHLTYANTMSTIAVFLALGGGVAWALDKDTVKSKHIVDGQVRSTDVADDSTEFALTGGDIANGSLVGGDVANDSLTGADVGNGSLSGADVDESSLGQVPSAGVGGYGRSFSGTGCNPTSDTFVDCGYVSVLLPSTSRVLLVGATRGYSPTGDGFGFCRLVTSNGVLSGTDVGVRYEDAVALTTTTGQLGPGQVDFGLECNQIQGDARFGTVRLSVVALSPS